MLPKSHKELRARILLGFLGKERKALWDRDAPFCQQGMVAPDPNDVVVRSHVPLDC
jgi:hypothetical protein